MAEFSRHQRLRHSSGSVTTKCQVTPLQLGKKQTNRLIQDSLSEKQPPLFLVPEYKVDTDNTLWLGVLVVVDDSCLGLHPHEASSLGQHAVLSCANLALREHWRQQEKQEGKLED